MKTRGWYPILALGILVPNPLLAANSQVSSGGSITAALAGSSSGDSIFVEEGTYTENIALVDGVVLLGGYDSSFSTRDPMQNRTIIDGSETAAAVTSGPTVGSGTVVDGFVITKGSGSGQAGVMISGGAPVFSNNDVTNNRGGLAGGFLINNGSSATLTGNRIRNNWSAGSGGGVRVENSSPRLLRNSLTDNVAPHHGGGIYSFNSATYCSSNTTVSCRSLEGGGGGLYLQDTPSGARFVDNTWRNCQGNQGAGALVKDESIVVMVRESFLDCDATSNGGGVAAYLYSDLTMTDCVIRDCTAGSSGGGIWILDTDFQLLGTDAARDAATMRIENCTANVSGGGLYVEKALIAVTNGVRISGCSAGSWGGGAYVLHTAITFSRNLIENCIAGEGGGLALRTSNRALHQTSTVRNNTIFGCDGTGTGNPSGGGLTLAAAREDNIAFCAGNVIVGTQIGAGIRCLRGGSETGTGSPIINCTSVFNDVANPVDHVFGQRCDNAASSDPTNQVDGTDPMLCNPTVGDYRLSSSSPAVASSCPNAGGKIDRGAHPDGDHCSGVVLSLEDTTWGLIKSMYR